ncbi:MAG: segregation/condensation protein A, partial [Planctomycetes bacterium]|nr:segregation/condensation protein A [Planctomycetota bacterium]
MSLNVTIPDTFNGPLGLLHSLILRDEIDIYDIPIARLTNSYLEEIKKLDIINVDEGAEFLDLASRLLEIKLRMLVPPEEGELEDAEEDDDFDPRGSLVEALLEYRRFKDAARLLGELAEEQARRFPRVAPSIEFRLVGEDNPDGVACLPL